MRALLTYPNSRVRVERALDALRRATGCSARTLRARLDPETYGGGYLLGLNGLVVVAHGSSSRVAIANAVRLAAVGVEHGVVARLQERPSPGVLASARSTTPTVER